MIPEPDQDNETDGEMDTLCVIALPFQVAALSIDTPFLLYSPTVSASSEGGGLGSYVMEARCRLLP